jgi:hypothetical protein
MAKIKIVKATSAQLQKSMRAEDYVESREVNPLFIEDMPPGPVRLFGDPGIMKSIGPDYGKQASDPTVGRKNMAEENKLLVGRTIKQVRKMTAKELEAEGWEGDHALVIELDNGTLVYPSRDDEGNGPGALFGSANGVNFYVTKED